MHLKCGKINVSLKHFHLADALIQSDLQCIQGIYFIVCVFLEKHHALQTEQQICTHCYKKDVSIRNTTLLCPDFISVQFTAYVQHISLYTWNCASPWECVLFLLPVKATPSFLPLIYLCRPWDMKRHFWHLFPICAPTQRPPEQVLFRLHLLSACLSPWSLAVQGKPRSYLSKETKKKESEFWEEEKEK